MNVALRFQIAASRLAPVVSISAITLDQQPKGEAVTLHNGCKLTRLAGGWWTIHGYHYCGDDVKYWHLILQGVTMPHLRAILDGKTVTWW